MKALLKKLKSVVKNAGGAAIMELALFFPLLILIGIGVYEVSNVSSAQSKLKNSVSSMALTVANVKMVYDPNNLPEARAVIEDTIGGVIEQTNGFLSEFDSGTRFHTVVRFGNQDILLEIERGDDSLVNGLGTGGRTDAFVACEIEGNVANKLGTVAMQTCVDYRASTPGVFGELSEWLASDVLCANACITVTSEQAPVVPTTSLTEGDERCANASTVGLPCRVQTQVDCFGPCFEQKSSYSSACQGDGYAPLPSAFSCDTLDGQCDSCEYVHDELYYPATEVGGECFVTGAYVGDEPTPNGNSFIVNENPCPGGPDGKNMECKNHYGQTLCPTGIVVSSLENNDMNNPETHVLPMLVDHYIDFINVCNSNDRCYQREEGLKPYDELGWESPKVKDLIYPFVRQSLECYKKMRTETKCKRTCEEVTNKDGTTRIVCHDDCDVVSETPVLADACSESDTCYSLGKNSGSCTKVECPCVQKKCVHSVSHWEPKSCGNAQFSAPYPDCCENAAVNNDGTLQNLGWEDAIIDGVTLGGKVAVDRMGGESGCSKFIESDSCASSKGHCTNEEILELGEDIQKGFDDLSECPGRSYFKNAACGAN